LMLQHIGEMDAASRIQTAIVKVLASGPEHRTRDIGGKGSTSDFTAAMCDTLRRGTRAAD
ncbi:MAG TPA: tartrate dehydrogenase, partial [Thermoanaerobaculia bacterium]